MIARSGLLRRAMVLLIALLPAACDRSSPSAPAAAAVATTGPTGLASCLMQIGSGTYSLEIAATTDAQEYGLMNRDSMPRDHGMIFVFDSEQPLNFYMKNTRFDLDIVFLDAAGRVVSIHTMKALDLTTVPSGAPAKYAIEINAGEAAACGVKVGDRLLIPRAAVAATNAG